MSEIRELLLVLALIAVVLTPVILIIVLKNRKLRREPLEEFAVVFEARWIDSKSKRLSLEVNLADDIYLVTGGGMVVTSMGGGGGRSWQSTFPQSIPW